VCAVADFGVARRLSSRSESMTAETGTYRWMAPEVIRHTRYDHRVDVYSFGIVAWEMLSGQLPYGELSPIQAAAAVVVENLRPPLGEGALPPGLPGALTALVCRCWDVEPGCRPEFREVAAAVGALRKAEAARVAARGGDEGTLGEGGDSDSERAEAAHAAAAAPALPLPPPPPLPLPPTRAPSTSSDGGASSSAPIDVPGSEWSGARPRASLSDVSDNEEGGGGDPPSFPSLDSLRAAAAEAGAAREGPPGAAPRRRSRGLLDLMGCCTQPGMGKSL
jgi:serine/threonine protein kinase